MNAAWLLKSSTLWGALGFSFLASLSILLFSEDGLPAQHRRRAELQRIRVDLLQKQQRNRELLEEVRKLAAKDPELLEALARRQGYARPGETVYTFRDRGERR